MYIVAKTKADRELGSGEMLERMLESFKPSDFSDPQKKMEFGDKVYAPLLFEKEWEQLQHEESVQEELLKQKKEREQQQQQEGEEEGGEKEESKTSETVKLATMEGFVNYKFIVAESMYRGRMRTTEPDQEDQQKQQ